MESTIRRRRLRTFSEKRVAQPVKADLSVYCSPHDLIAIVTESSDIVVYRINGQIAFTIKRREPDVEVTAVQWKPSGTLLSVGWSDGTYAIHSGENGRLVSQSTVRQRQGGGAWKLDLTPDFGDDDDEDPGPAACLFGWASHSPPADRQRNRARNGTPENPRSDELWDNIARLRPKNDLDDEEDADAHSRASLADLPRAITTLDVTKVLPRLSAIPSHGLRSGPEGSKFATQSATDGVFETPANMALASINSLLVCSDDGSVEVLLDETVPIGSCRLGANPTLHATHPHSSCNALLSSNDSGTRLHVFDLPISALSSPLLHAVARDTKRIQSLLAYIAQSIRCISHDFTAGLTFPTRLINNINAELSKNGEGDLVQNLYHLALTGEFTAVMLEWLVDIVKETNHKRWDQAVGGMYTHIQNHIFVNLLPALDRMSIAVSNLRGHAKLHEGSSKFEVEPELFKSVLEGIDALRLVAHKVQLACMSEYQQFRAFSKWLRLQIEIGVAKPFTKNAAESEERGVPDLEYSLILTYIKDTMMSSKLAIHIQQATGLKGSCSKQDFFAHPLMARMGYEHAAGALKRLETAGEEKKNGAMETEDSLASVNLPAITVALTGHVRAAIERITQWQSKMLSSPACFDLALEPETRITDVRMVEDNRDGCGAHAMTILTTSTIAKHVLQYSTVDFAASSNAGGIVQSDINSAVLPSACNILDAKFVDDHKALLLVSTGKSGHALEAVLHTTGGHSDVYAIPRDSLGEFGAPEKLLVGGRQGKKVCVVFGSGGTEWRVFDLESKVNFSDAAAGTVDDEWEDENMDMS